MVMDEESGRLTPVLAGDDYICPNCGCEIHVRHRGEPDRVERPRPFTCYCGTEMLKEPR